MPAVAVPAAVCCCWAKMRFGAWLAGWLVPTAALGKTARRVGRAIGGRHSTGWHPQPSQAWTASLSLAQSTTAAATHRHVSCPSGNAATAANQPSPARSVPSHRHQVAKQMLHDTGCLSVCLFAQAAY
ncbi:hypothetical protein BC831DRAFT_449262, partial [Entophlyctis helioformis]